MAKFRKTKGVISFPRKSYYQKHKGELLEKQRKNRIKKRSDCENFRLMMTNRILRDSIFCENHLIECAYCQAWYHSLKKTEEESTFEGANFW